MSTLLKRILFVVILLLIAYGIYWMIDKKRANNLKEDIVSTTQKTVDSLKPIDTPQSDLPSDDGESLGTLEEVLIQRNVVVSDPEIKAPVIQTVSTKTTTTKTTSTKKTTG